MRSYTNKPDYSGLPWGRCWLQSGTIASLNTHSCPLPALVDNQLRVQIVLPPLLSLLYSLTPLCRLATILTLGRTHTTSAVRVMSKLWQRAPGSIQTRLCASYGPL